jgi:hypothetical protein
MAKRKFKDRLIGMEFDRHGRPWACVRFHMPDGQFVQAGFKLAIWDTPPREIAAQTQSALNMAPKTVVRAHAVQRRGANSQSHDVEGNNQ